MTKMLFNKDNSTVSISEVKLQKDYAFMYENFIVSSQHKLILLLEQTNNQIDTLQFDFLIYKYGYPNDEAGHPLYKYGLGFYGLFKVTNSPWIAEIREHNLQHSRHSDDTFANTQHYIAKFKDVTLEIICRKMMETQITKAELLAIVDEQIKLIEK